MKYGKFFEIEGKAEARDFAFLVAAISDDETRYFMNVTLFEDNKLIATDGRRMHILDIEGMNPGFEEGKTYRFLRKTQKTVWFAEADAGGPFPNYKRVIPDNEPEKTFEFTAYRRNEPGYHHEMAIFFRNIYGSDVINLSYLDDLALDEDYTVELRGEHKVIIFRSINKTAYIMPTMQ